MLSSLSVNALLVDDGDQIAAVVLFVNSPHTDRGIVVAEGNGIREGLLIAQVDWIVFLLEAFQISDLIFFG
jgi:hypothetical protein